MRKLRQFERPSTQYLFAGVLPAWRNIGRKEKKGKERKRKEKRKDWTFYKLEKVFH